MKEYWGQKQRLKEIERGGVRKRFKREIEKGWQEKVSVGTQGNKSEILQVYERDQNR